MAVKDLHEKPFDEGTKAKLEIFEDYAEAWIPTFVMQTHIKTICIFDFFAGTGYDVAGVAGSPIRILQKIKEHIGNILNKQVKIKVYLNEFEPNKTIQNKFELLKIACNKYLEDNKDVNRAIEIKYFNENFEILFPKLTQEIEKFPSLVYLDQNGVKFISDIYMLALEKMKQTDFLYFVSSSHLKRFGEEEEFMKSVRFDIDAIKKAPHHLIHRVVVEQLKNKLPPKSNLKLYPFTIKKGVNIHGLVFGASHVAAIDKFLSITWKRYETNGEANFDIDDDANKNQLDIFNSEKKLTKIESFKKNLKERVLSGKIKNNFEALEFVYEEGHFRKHAADCLKDMKTDKQISYEGNSPLITYEKVHKEKKQIQYKILKT